MWALCSVQQERPLCIADVSTKPLTFGRASWLYRRRDAPIRNKDVNHMSHPFQRNPKFELLARSKDFGPVHLSKVTRPSENENPREKRFGHIRDIRDAMGLILLTRGGGSLGAISALTVSQGYLGGPDAPIRDRNVLGFVEISAMQRGRSCCTLQGSGHCGENN